MKQAGAENFLKCQNCHLPLELDTSLWDLSLSQQDLLISSLGKKYYDNGSTNIKIPANRLEKLKSAKSPDEINKLLKETNSDPRSSYIYLDGKRNVMDSNLSVSRESELDDLTSNNNDKNIKNEPILSTQISTLSNIFNILSSKSSIDYPVCQDCCDILIKKLKTEYNDSMKEKETYSEFLNKLEKQHKIELETEKNKKVLTKPREKNGKEDTNEPTLEDERKHLLDKLLQLENEEDRLDEEISKLKEKKIEKEMNDMKELSKINLENLKQLEFIKDLQNLQNQYELALNNLDILRKTNIYNETFRISHDGPFGTINGLRLGGFPETKVTWNEINAALGHIVLLLSLIITKLNCPLKEYKLIVMGSFSKISRYDPTTKEWTTVEAYYDQNFKFTKLFHKETSFDKALGYLLDIVQELASYVINSNQTNSRVETDIALFSHGTSENNNIIDSDLEMRRSVMTSQTSNNNNNNIPIRKISTNEEIQELPYTMFDDKINALPVKLYGNEPTLKWTTAMKFLLTNIKWLLAFSSPRLTAADNNN